MLKLVVLEGIARPNIRHGISDRLSICLRLQGFVNASELDRGWEDII